MRQPTDETDDASYVTAITEQPLPDGHRTTSESTNPFPPGFVEARIGKEVFPVWYNLHLDNLYFRNPNARLLLRPKTERIAARACGLIDRPAGKWQDVRTEDPVKTTTPVLVLTPALQDTGFKITHDSVYFCLIFDPESDIVELDNGPAALWVERLDRDGELQVGPQQQAHLDVGIWRFKKDTLPLCEIQILERTHWRISRSPYMIRPSTESSSVDKPATKRPAPTQVRASKRIKNVTAQGVAVIAESSNVSAEQLHHANNPLSNLKDGQTMFLTGPRSNYWIKRDSLIAENTKVAVWKGFGVGEARKTHIAVKALKTTSSGRSSISSAKEWKEEVRIHKNVTGHPSIVRLFAADARFHSLYMEYVDAPPLSFMRGPTNHFRGTLADTLKVLDDMSSALEFIHAKGFVHNDVKPDNILYGPERGPVLIDFGLSFDSGSPKMGGGTPWYLPAEVKGSWDQRDSPADVWALGIVMLWLLGYIPLPDLTFKSWIISDLHDPNALPAERKAAHTEMNKFINYIKSVRSKLRQDLDLEVIVYKMLDSVERKRIDAEDVAQQLRHLCMSSFESDI